MERRKCHGPHCCNQWSCMWQAGQMYGALEPCQSDQCVSVQSYDIQHAVLLTWNGAFLCPGGKGQEQRAAQVQRNGTAISTLQGQAACYATQAVAERKQILKGLCNTALQSWVECAGDLGYCNNMQIFSDTMFRVMSEGHSADAHIFTA